jgi:C1A family cysteine protease
MKRSGGFVCFVVFSVAFLILQSPLRAEQKEAGRLQEFTASDTLEQLREKIEHNAYQFSVGHNWVYDMSTEEKEHFFGLRRPPKLTEPEGVMEMGPLTGHLGKVSLPSHFDWRDYNGHSYIGPIKDQGYCGSCYAFGAAAAAEGAYNYFNGFYDDAVQDFSESYIIWCLGKYGPYSDSFTGCDGADYGYKEVEALTKEGITEEANFPYTVNDPNGCTHWSDPVVVFQSWFRVPCGDIDAIKTAIMTYGPVDAAVYVGSAFQAYSGGIYQDSRTSCNAQPCYYTTVNHAVSLVGWDDNNGNGYWILRNSWGKSWGENGYMRIKYTSAAVSCSAVYLVFDCTGSKLSIQALSPLSDFVVAPSSSVLVNGRVATDCGQTVKGATVSAAITGEPDDLTLYDDGNHSDGEANDGNYANLWTPSTVRDPVTITISAAKTGYTSTSTTIKGKVATVSSEGFDGALFPPSGWKVVRTNASETWRHSTSGIEPRTGPYCAAVYYDESLEHQDELLMSPVLPEMNSGKLTFWSKGSIYWGVDPYDNYDVEVWLIKGQWDAGTNDDEFLAKLDTTWPDNWVYAKKEVDLTPYLQSGGQPLRIGFRYIGADGGAVYIDDVEIAYSPSSETGAVRVELAPEGAVQAGAQWKLDAQETAHGSLDTVSNLSVGTHKIRFTTITGWATPPSQDVEVVASETAVATGVYTEQSGSITVSITPDTVDGKWRVDGDEWQESGATVENLSVGSHTVSFSHVDGWITPSPETVTVAADQTTSVPGVYSRTGGGIICAITPDPAAKSGAAWKVDDEEGWHASGVTIRRLSAGSHTITFKDLPGWITPPQQKVTVLANQITDAASVYIKLDVLSSVGVSTPRWTGFAALLNKKTTSYSASVLIKDFATGNTVKELPFFNPQFRAVGLAAIQDTTDDGGQEIGVVGVRQDGAGKLLAVKLQLKETLTGRLVRDIYFDKAYMPIALSAYYGSNARRFALLGEDTRGGQSIVQIRNAKTGDLVKNITVGTGSSIKSFDLKQIAGTTRLAILQRNTSTRTSQLKIVDAGTGGTLKTFTCLNRTVTPVTLARISNYSLAIIGKNATGMTVVEIRDTRDGTLVGKVDFNQTLAPIDALGCHIDGSKLNDLGILGLSTSTGTVHLQVRNTESQKVVAEFPIP